MGYEQEVSSTKRVGGVVIVLLLHVLMIYALMNGLAQKLIKVIHDPVEVNIIDEVKLPPPPPEEPPPPPKATPKPVTPPPVYVPEPQVHAQSTDAPSITATTNELPPPSAPVVVHEAPVEVPVAPTPKPHIPVKTKAALSGSCVPPKYPEESLDNEEEGTVVWSFLIDVEGHVTDSKLLKSSGFSRLDEAARAALSKCNFTAATVDGKPEISWAQQSFEWKIK